MPSNSERQPQNNPDPLAESPQGLAIPEGIGKPVEMTIETNLSGSEYPDFSIRFKTLGTLVDRAWHLLAKRGFIPVTKRDAVVFTAIGIAAAQTMRELYKRRHRMEDRSAGPITPGERISGIDLQPTIEQRDVPALTEKQGADFVQAYGRTVSQIYAFIFNRVGDTQLAQNLTQEVYFRALRKYRSFVPDQRLKDPFLAWFYRIAHNLVANEFRRGVAERKYLDPERSIEIEEDHPSIRAAVVDSAEDILIAKQGKYEMIPELKRIRKALASLPDNLRDKYLLVIWLDVVEGFSNKEIAWILDKSELAVKTIIYRIRKKLTRLLEEQSE